MTNVRKTAQDYGALPNKRNQLRGKKKKKRAINNSSRVFADPRKKNEPKMREERLMETERTITMMGN
jgi:hypothetical protein